MLPTTSTMSSTTTSPLQTTTQSEKLSSDIWIPVVSVFAALLVVICVGYIIYKACPKSECVKRNPETQESKAKTMKNRKPSERSYELPYSNDINSYELQYSVDINSEYEEYDENLYEEYKK